MNSYFGKVGEEDNEERNKPVCLIIDEVDGAIGGGTSADSSKGIQKVVDYLKKCISYVPKVQKKNK
jgi:hypothetical protein